MKKNIALLAGLMTACVVHAQTEVTAGVMRGKEYGVTYLLPQTEIQISVHVTRHTYTPGEFCKYADRYLRMGNVRTESETRWSIDKVEIGAIGIPDKEKVYFVKLKDKTVAPLMELTEDGIVRSINMTPGQRTSDKARQEPPAKEKEVDPRSFLTQEILMASSRAKMAELVAKEIYSIRESKNALLRGEADNMPKDGAQLKLMIDHLNLQEQAMTEMFSGKTRTESSCVTISLTPKEMDEEVLFRFSRHLGLVDKDDLAGEPYCISITDLKNPPIPADDEKQKSEGVAYNVPGRAHVVVSGGGRKLYDGEMPVSQFGTTEYLAPVLFNKNSTIKVLFDTTTGGLLKVDKE